MSIPPDDCEECEGLSVRVATLERRARAVDVLSALIGALVALAQHLL